MLESSWEAYATAVSNTVDDDALIAELEKIVSAARIDLSQRAVVVLGYDTRPSCPALVAALKDGLTALGAEIVDAGLVTTPQLHYLVRCRNTAGTAEAYGEPTEAGYYAKLAAAWKTLTADRPAGPDDPPLTVDCANGVGAPKLKALHEVLGGDAGLKLRVIGDDVSTPGALNRGCGADHVKTGQHPPTGVKLTPGARYCSLDGDADRVVFYYADERGVFHLLDGDKIATLAAMYIIELVKQAGLSIDVGVVQTAYANGSATTYVESLVRRAMQHRADGQGIPVTCTPTGVKYLHHAAESFDIGVYFEANGHGTVLFSPTVLETIRAHTPRTSIQRTALGHLTALTELINQTVGDALSDMLMVEVILRRRGWGPHAWDKAYTDLPNRLLKVLVKDRTAFKTEDAERTLVQPIGVQAQIDKIVAKYPRGRSFVRPSGTEDCVRVYAEAERDADGLARAVASLIFAGYGLGEMPKELR